MLLKGQTGPSEKGQMRQLCCIRVFVVNPLITFAIALQENYQGAQLQHVGRRFHFLRKVCISMCYMLCTSTVAQNVNKSVVFQTIYFLNPLSYKGKRITWDYNFSIYLGRSCHFFCKICVLLFKMYLHCKYSFSYCCENLTQL